MHSVRAWNLVVLGGVLAGVHGAALPTPAITPAPRAVEVEERQIADALSIARLLLTALPQSLRQIAATDLPALSSILWEEFLDDNKPSWFWNLPQDIQSELIVEFGPETAWPTSAPASLSSANDVTASPTSDASTTASESTTPSASGSLSSDSASAASFSDSSISRSSASQRSSTRASSRTSSRRPTATAVTDAGSGPSNSGLTKGQKIGLGIGIPLALLAIAALLLACCCLIRRRRRRRVEGIERNASPGFIPRSSFHDKSGRAPLNRGFDQPTAYTGATNWDDDGYDPLGPDEADKICTCPTPVVAPMAMHDSKPIMAPAAGHTHTSNRARGKRTSYTSLHSVAEVREPDDLMTGSSGSPVSGGRPSPPQQRPRRRSLTQSLSQELFMDAPPAVPVLAAGAGIKRKPISTGSISTSPAAEAASRSMRPPLTKTTTLEHSGSGSSGPAVSDLSDSSTYSVPIGYHNNNSTPISPVSTHAPKNPFSDGYAYLEDYGPEYSQNGYVDHGHGMYGGHRSSDRYPDPSPPRSSKTEWPLKNMIGSSHKRNHSPMWDRVYDH